VVSYFITFEGIEGSGKSTHARHVATHLRALGRGVVETREPGGTGAGRAIRQLLLAEHAVPLAPLAETLLYVADRAQHVSEVIVPALARGQLVLCDRFSDSTFAYQGYGRGLDLEVLRALDARVRAGVTPGLTLLFDCPVDVGLERARRRPGPSDRMEQEMAVFHERVRAGFHRLAAAEPARFHVVDSTRAEGQVRALVVAEVMRRLALAEAQVPRA
jgi:dTMP kinase